MRVDDMQVATSKPRRLWPAAYVFVFFALVGLGLFAWDGSFGHIVFFGLVSLATAAGFMIHAKARRGANAGGTS